MDMKNNSHPDTNVGNLKFQPIPKRFMVWSISHKRWLKGRNGTFVMDLVDISKELRNNPHLPDNCIIVQSTNLFDKDGKEIFEGSIVLWNGDMGVVKSRNDKWVFHVTTPAFSVYHELGPNADMVKAIGHVLTNPELLEEK